MGPKFCSKPPKNINQVYYTANPKVPTNVNLFFQRNSATFFHYIRSPKSGNYVLIISRCFMNFRPVKNAKHEKVAPDIWVPKICFPKMYIFCFGPQLNWLVLVWYLLILRGFDKMVLKLNLSLIKRAT